jgi:hypothetical protein
MKKEAKEAMVEELTKLILFDDTEAIFGADDRPVEMVDVPEWGMRVRVRGMSAQQRIAFSEGLPMLPLKSGEKEEEQKVDNRLFKPYMLTYCIVNKDGQPMFKPSDAERLLTRNVAAIDRLYEVAERLCGMGKKQQKEMRGNSVAAPSAG